MGLALLKGSVPSWAKTIDGYGNGYGNGYGYGNGDGYGNGYGNGDGDGDGYGNGYGNGDGYGYGYGCPEYNRALFVRAKKLEVRDGAVVLFKSTKTNRTDARTGTVKYEGVVECPDWDDNVDRECGGGLHLSATPEDALQFHNDGTVLRCRVKLEDFLVYRDKHEKVRCRRVEVLGLHNSTETA